jgi:tetratricopeptide (TPR) repeat protein
LWVALLLLATVVVFGRTLTHEFIEYDDDVNVYLNPGYNPLTAEGVARFWREPYSGLYIPVTYTFFAAEALLSPRTPPDVAGRDMTPAIFHAGNLALHCVVVLLVFALIRRLVPGVAAAGIGALLFAVHPLQVESVAWITETRGLLCAAFGFAALLLYLPRNEAGEGEAEGRASPRPTRRLRYAGATLCLVLALLSKPVAASIPILAAIIALGLLRRPWQQTALTLAPWMALAIAAALVTKGQQPATTLPPAGLVDRLCVAGDSLVFYASKVVAPLHVAPMYDRPLDQRLSDGAACWSWLVVALGAALVVLLMGWRDAKNHARRRMALVAIALFAAALAPQLGLVTFEYQRISTVADRYAYLALLGPALGVAALMDGLRSRAAYGAAALLIVGLGAASFAMTSHWQNDETFFAFALAQNPRSADAHNGLGNIAYRAGDTATAEGHYREALALRPDHATAHRNLGLVLARRGEWAAAAGEFQRAVDARPNFADAYRSLGQARLRMDEPDAAVEAFRHALAILPDSRTATAELGVTLLKLGRFADAEAHYRAATARFPDWPGAHVNLAVALAQQDRYAEAAAEARRAVALAPAMPEARDTLEKIQQLQRGK